MTENICPSLRSIFIKDSGKINQRSDSFVCICSVTEICGTWFLTAFAAVGKFDKYQNFLNLNILIIEHWRFSNKLWYT